MALSLKNFIDKVVQRFSTDAFKDYVLYANEHLTDIKQEILDEVEGHPVSQELRNHTMPSSFLDSRSATLFGFLGFNEGDDPVGNLLEALNDLITINSPRATLVNRIANASVKMTLPNWRDLRADKSLLLEWDSISWPEGIKNGVSGLSHYINSNAAQSRSKEGIQIKADIRDAQFTGTPFLDEIFKAARKKIKKYNR